MNILSTILSFFILPLISTGLPILFVDKMRNYDGIFKINKHIKEIKQNDCQSPNNSNKPFCSKPKQSSQFSQLSQPVSFIPISKSKVKFETLAFSPTIKPTPHHLLNESNQVVGFFSVKTPSSKAKSYFIKSKNRKKSRESLDPYGILSDREFTFDDMFDIWSNKKQRQVLLSSNENSDEKVYIDLQKPTQPSLHRKTTPKITVQTTTQKVIETSTLEKDNEDLAQTEIAVRKDKENPIDKDGEVTWKEEDDDDPFDHETAIPMEDFDSEIENADVPKFGHFIKLHIDDDFRVTPKSGNFIKIQGNPEDEFRATPSTGNFIKIQGNLEDEFTVTPKSGNFIKIQGNPEDEFADTPSTGNFIKIRIDNNDIIPTPRTGDFTNIGEKDISSKEFNGGTPSSINFYVPIHRNHSLDLINNTETTVSPYLVKNEQTMDKLSKNSTGKVSEISSSVEMTTITDLEEFDGTDSSSTISDIYLDEGETELFDSVKTTASSVKLHPTTEFYTDIVLENSTVYIDLLNDSSEEDETTTSDIILHTTTEEVESTTFETTPFEVSTEESDIKTTEIPTQSGSNTISSRVFINLMKGSDEFMEESTTPQTITTTTHRPTRKSTTTTTKRSITTTKKPPKTTTTPTTNDPRPTKVYINLVAGSYEYIEDSTPLTIVTSTLTSTSTNKPTTTKKPTTTTKTPTTTEPDESSEEYIDTTSMATKTTPRSKRITTERNHVKRTTSRTELTEVTPKKVYMTLPGDSDISDSSESREQTTPKLPKKRHHHHHHTHVHHDKPSPPQIITIIQKPLEKPTTTTTTTTTSTTTPKPTATTTTTQSTLLQILKTFIDLFNDDDSVETTTLESEEFIETTTIDPGPKNVFIDLDGDYYISESGEFTTTHETTTTTRKPTTTTRRSTTPHIEIYDSVEPDYVEKKWDKFFLDDYREYALRRALSLNQHDHH